MTAMDPDFGGLLFDNFDAVFMVVATLVVLGAVFVFGSIVWGAVGSARQKARDNAAPEVAAVAEVVDKRVALSGGGTSRTPGALSADGTFGPSTAISTPIRAPTT